MKTDRKWIVQEVEKGRRLSDKEKRGQGEEEDCQIRRREDRKRRGGRRLSDKEERGQEKERDEDIQIRCEEDMKRRG